jgi:hypothetical protein
MQRSISAPIVIFASGAVMSAADYAGLQAKGEKGGNRSAINLSF